MKVLIQLLLEEPPGWLIGLGSTLTTYVTIMYCLGEL